MLVTKYLDEVDYSDMVNIYLNGKLTVEGASKKLVTMADGVNESYEITNAQAYSMIRLCEREIERKLNPRYKIPFQGFLGEDFSTLPANTQSSIKDYIIAYSAERLLLVYQPALAKEENAYPSYTSKNIFESLMSKNKSNGLYAQDPLEGLAFSWNTNPYPIYKNVRVVTDPYPINSEHASDVIIQDTNPLLPNRW